MRDPDDACPHDVQDFCQIATDDLWADVQHPGSGSDGALMLVEALCETRQPWVTEHRDTVLAYLTAQLDKAVTDGDAQGKGDWSAAITLVRAV